MNSAYLYYVYYREKLFNFLKNSEDTIYLLDGSSYAIKNIRTVSMKVHDGIVRKLGEIRYISNFKKNIISLSKLDSTGSR